MNLYEKNEMNLDNKKYSSKVPKTFKRSWYGEAIFREKLFIFRNSSKFQNLR